MTLNVELVDSLAEFMALAPEWDAALARSPGASVFLTHAWLVGSWSFLAPGRQLHALVLRDGRRLLGALPMALEKQRWRGFTVRTLVFLTDPVTCNVRSDMLVDGDPEQAVEAFGRYLRATRGQWDAAVLDSMSAESPLVAGYDAFCAAGRVLGRPLEEYWRLHNLPVETDWDAYMQQHTAHSREHMRRERAKLARLGGVTSEFSVEPAAVLVGLELFLSLEQRTAKRRKDDYTVLDERLQSYLRAQFRGLANAGFAIVATLRLDGVPVASALLARFQGVIHTLNDVYDAQFEKAYPGHYLRGEIVRYAWQEGYRTVDFNGYGQHLQRWRTHPRSFYRALFYSSSAYGRFLSMCKFMLVPALRRLVPARWQPPIPALRPGDRGLEPAK